VVCVCVGTVKKPRASLFKQNILVFSSQSFRTTSEISVLKVRFASSEINLVSTYEDQQPKTAWGKVKSG